MSVVLRLTKQGTANPEGVRMEDTFNWKSPVGGWLKVQEGVWAPGGPAGSRLYDASRSINVGFMKGLIYAACTVGDKGEFLDEGNGDAVGVWEVIAN